MQVKRERLKSAFLIVSWALYDLANQFFAVNVATVYFIRWLALEKKAPEILYSLSFGISTFFIAVLGFILGVASDSTGRRKPPLVYLTLLSVVFTAALGFRDSVLLNLIFFAVANFGCQTAIVFYNALLTDVAPREKLGLISGVGRAFGYSGAILALYLVRPIVVSGGYRAAFVPTAILFLIFSLPCLIFVRDNARENKTDFAALLNGDNLRRKLGGLLRSARSTYALNGMSDFFKASFFAMAAVNTILLFIAVYATKVFGLGEDAIVRLIAFSTVFAVLGSLFSGCLSDYFGDVRSLVAVYLLWMACFLFGALAQSARSCYLIGALVGFALGATWAVSRSLAARLVPREKMGTVFGLFNLIGQLAAIVGAMSWGALLLFLGRFGEAGYRLTLLSLNIFMAFGAVFIARLLKLGGKDNVYG